MNSATLASNVRLARTLFAEGSIGGMDTNLVPVEVSIDSNGVGSVSETVIRHHLSST